MSREAVERGIAALLARQDGIISRGQAVRAGATKSNIETYVRNGRWLPVHRGVYRLAGVALSWRRDLLAACLACRTGVASFGAAGRVWELPGFRDAVTEVSVDGDVCRCRGFTIHRVDLPRIDVTVVDAIPVTTPARTLIDLAGVVPRDAAEEALDDALRRRLFSRSRLRWRLEALAAKGRPGGAVLRELLAAREDGTSVPQSVFETRFLRELRDARMPRPTRQYEVRERGRLVAVVDFAYPNRKIAIEADGYRWHSARMQWERDLDRRNVLTALGWQLLHVTWTELRRRPDVVMAHLRGMLGQP